MKLLHVDSSILGDVSVSRSVSKAVVDALRQGSGPVEVTYRDLAAAPLPHQAVLPAGHPLTAPAMAERARDDALDTAVLAEFLAADTIVIGAPMYNFTIPSQLKAWIDRLLVPGKTFGYGPNGVEGLAGAKRVIVVVSRGGLYGAGTPYAAAEHAETYLRTVLGFIGIAPEFIVAEGTQRGSESRQAALDGALQAATVLRAA